MSIYRLRDTDVDDEIARERSREPILASVIVHLLLVIGALLVPPRRVAEVLSADAAPRAFLALPPPRPTPPPPARVVEPERERISVGSRRPQNDRPLLLERDREISAEDGKGEARASDANGTETGHGEEPEAKPSPVDGGEKPAEAVRDDRFRRPSGSLRESTERSVERRSRQSDLGAPTGVVGQQMGALFFDPQGADFTRWINHFRREVYRNWLLPQPALLGLSGRVKITFQVERDGAVSASVVSGPSGIPAFDRSSANAIRASQLLPLPADFTPPRVIMDVVFIYNER